MIEPPRSRRLRRWMSIPALLAWAVMYLAGAPESMADPGKPCTGFSPGKSSESRVLRRDPPHRPDWNQPGPKLTPRPVRAKIPPVSPPGRAHRLIVKFADSLEARANADGLLTANSCPAGKPGALEHVVDSLQLQFRPLHSAPAAALQALRKRAELLSGQQQPDAAGTLEVIAKNSAPATILAAVNALLPLAEVEYVEIESLDAPPPPPASDAYPATPSLVTYQTYRGTSQGIGVDYVWETLGIKGHPSLRITDCEYMFNPRHEDLDALVTIQPNVSSMYSAWGDNHGTAVTGILAAGDNDYGMSGAVPDCQMHFYPEYATMVWGYTQSRTSTITAAIAASAPGDIVMLEMQTKGPNNEYGPAEYSLSVWNAVKMATDSGIIVIAASGNDHEDLDGPAWASYRSRGDSGAIIVGAGDTERARQSFSTYGSRVNLQGWGAGVATTGYGSLATYGNDPNQRYTTSFNGTSSATPIVAAAAALVQSVAIERLGTRLTPAEMRSLLIASGNPQSGDTSKAIGPLPDLSAAIPQLLATEFASDSPIAIPDVGEATPSPSIIPVSGVEGIVSSVRVRINGLTHGEPRNLDVLLVGPSGQVAALMSDAGGSYNLTNATLMFDDAAATAIPEASTIASGRYQPTNYGWPLESPPPGALGGVGTRLNALAADGANGEWKLYVTDDFPGDSGSIESWSISFETIPYPVVSLAEANRVVSEGGSVVILTATLNEATTMDVSVPLTITGNASEPEDFTISGSPILIPAGQTSGSATLTLAEDDLDEDNEVVVVSMDSPVHATPGDITAVTITILDNDVTLLVESEFGDPTPGIAGDVIPDGTEVLASVTSPVYEDEPAPRRHVCTGWTGTGSAPESGSSSSTSFEIYETTRITWRWRTEDRLDIFTSGGGTVDHPGGWFPEGSQATLTAAPDAGYHFAGWNVDPDAIAEGTAEDAQITVRIDQALTVTANFAINTHPLEYAAGPGGSIVGNPSQLVDHGSDGTPVEAIPDAGYEFTAWSDGGTENPRTDIQVLAGLSVTADFLKLPAGNLVVETAIDNPLAHSAALDFGSRVIATSPVIISLTLRNTGDAPLTDLLAAIEIGGSTAFLQDGSATSLEPGASTTLHLSFTPLSAGIHTATLSIASSDPDANLFQLLLSGTGKTAREAYDDWLASNTPAPPATAQIAVATLLTYAFSPDPAARPCLSCEASGSGTVFRLSYLRRRDSGLIYAPLQMPDPAGGPRDPMIGTETSENINPEWQRVTIEQEIDLLAPRLFFTVEVTLPDAP